MQLPFVGPLAYIPMQAAAAYLLDLLLRKQPLSGTIAGPTQVLSSDRGSLCLGDCIALVPHLV